MTLHTCHEHLKTNIYIVENLVEKYIVEHLTTFRGVLKLLEYIVVLHTDCFVLEENYHIILPTNK